MAVSKSSFEPVERFSARLLSGVDDPFFNRDTGSTNNVFQSIAFLRAVETHLATGNARLKLVAVTDRSGDPVAVFAFVSRRRFGLPVLEGLDFGITDYCAPTLLRHAPLSEEETGRVWKAVIDVVPGVHAIAFKKLPRRLLGRPHALSAASFLKPMGAYATTLHLGGDSGTPVLCLEKMALAREVRRKSKKLMKLGPLTFAEASTDAEVDACMAKLVAFRTERFAQLGRRDALLDPNVVAFYRSLADRSSPEPVGRLFSLTAGEHVVATVYGLAYAGVFTVIAPAITTCKHTQAGSPGLVALFKALEWAKQQGFEVFDLSVGSLSYKSKFEAEQVVLFEHQRALTPLGSLIVAEAGLRRWVRHRLSRNPKLRPLVERSIRLRPRLWGERSAHA